MFRGADGNVRRRPYTTLLHPEKEIPLLTLHRVALGAPSSAQASSTALFSAAASFEKRAPLTAEEAGE